MSQFIDKSVIIAEMERRLDELYNLLPNASKVENGIITISEACNTGKYTALESFRNYIDTLDAKEIDLEKEIQQHINDCLDIKFPTTDIKMIAKDVEHTARMFFGLGLKAKGE